MSIKLTTVETIEVCRTDGTLQKVTGHRYQDFAAHRRLDEQTDMFASRWTVTHLPTARSVARDFSTVERAADAMIEFARLRNDWAVIDDEAITSELRDKCREIAARHGGRVGIRDDKFSRESVFNGYSTVTNGN
jgi:hypothetical protein